MTIFLILATLVINGFRQDDNDRLSSSARTLQAALEGARSKAIAEKRRVGLQLYPSPGDPHVVTSFAYVGSSQYDEGTATLAYSPTLAAWVVFNQTPGEWPFMNLPGTGRTLIRTGARIELPAGTGKWYSIASYPAPSSIPNYTNAAVLAGHYTPSTYSAGPPQTWQAQPATNVPYRLELAPTLLPNKEPVNLDRGIAIDLDASVVPGTWRPASPVSGPYGQMQIMFDPRGNLTGDLAAAGLIHLYLTKVGDVELTRLYFTDHPTNGTAMPMPWPIVPSRVDATTGAPIVPTLSPVVITLYTQTGQVTTSPANLIDIVVNATGAAGTDGQADVPYSYARRGMEAK
jgi:hypothetical protein